MLEKLQAIPIKRASGFQKQTLTEHIYLGNNPLKFKVYFRKRIIPSWFKEKLRKLNITFKFKVKLRKRNITLRFNVEL